MDNIHTQIIVSRAWNDEVGVLAIKALSELVEDPVYIFFISFSVYIPSTYNRISKSFSKW